METEDVSIINADASGGANEANLDPSTVRHGSASKRKRGRTATACSQCHSRKQKCDNSRPCANCMRRGIPHSCHSRRDISSVEPDSTLLTEPGTSSPRVGQLWNSRGAPTFYGMSYFGPQVAAKMIQSQAPDLAYGVHTPRSSASESFRNEAGPFSQLWDLLGLLPRQKSTVDRLTEKFMVELNWAIDAIHPETFRQNYNKFWDRKFGFDDVTTVDLRWLALLFAMLALAELLDCPQPCSPERQRESEESSLRFYWAARRAIVIAPSFYGESSDLVRAGILVTRYLIHSGRLSESWLTIGFASRFAMAQGMHVDGERWHLPRKAIETRRRLWSHLYTLDRMISLALGRPYAIADQHCLTKPVTNIWVDEMSEEEAVAAQSRPLSDPTPSIMSMFNNSLAQIIGRIQDKCFGLDPPVYDTVLNLDKELLKWKDELPSYFSLHNPDLSLDDDDRPFLKWHRLYLHTNYHFARITLHRPYLLRNSIENGFQYSRNACMESATIDLQSRLSIHNVELVERFRWGLGSHQLFNSALVLGIIAVRSPNSQESYGIMKDLEAYCEKQNSDLWMNEFGLAEVKVVQMCITRAKHLRSNTQEVPSQLPDQQPPPTVDYQYQVVDPRQSMALPRLPISPLPSEAPMQFQPYFDMPNANIWADPFASFSLVGDFDMWQEMINTIGMDTSAL
ncbi:fungal-specific transcription factor domain-containing protein [Leptodontidium sp. MPI-SDFR-AT-0119]|nr:fungal-specific transcription factor domain-containing protein [Leptodontidium sp. MPI-SDFR-AT-0119]